MLRTQTPCCTEAKRPAESIQDLYFRLLVGAVRLVAAGDAAALMRLAPDLSDVDALDDLWVRELFLCHRSPLLIAHALIQSEEAGVLDLPEPFSERLHAIYAAGQRRNTVLMQECSAVMDALDVPVTTLKGAWLVSHGVYPNASRFFGDLDFAVEPTVDRARIIRSLGELGYIFQDLSAQDHLGFHREEPGLRLYDGLPARENLPKRMNPVNARLETLRQAFFMQKTFFVEVQSNLDRVRALRSPLYFRAEDHNNAARHLLLLCHHLCVSDFNHSYGVVDVALMLRSPLVDWEQFAGLVEEFGAQEICAATFGIVERCFGEDMLPDEATRLRAYPAFYRGKQLGRDTVLSPAATVQGRWLSIRICRSLPSCHRAAIMALSPIVPRNFPLRWLHRKINQRIKRRRTGRFQK